ncbi:unnamed protein product, partial [Amoebophrya sp. A120]
ATDELAIDGTDPAREKILGRKYLTDYYQAESSSGTLLVFTDITANFAGEYRICWENPYNYFNSTKDRTGYDAWELTKIDIRGPMRVDVFAPTGSVVPAASNYPNVNSVQSINAGLDTKIDIEITMHYWDYAHTATKDDEFLITQDCHDIDSYLTSLLTHAQISASNSSHVLWKNVALPRSTTRERQNYYEVCYKLNTHLASSTRREYEVVLRFNTTGPSIEVQTCLATAPYCLLRSWTFGKELGGEYDLKEFQN